VFFVFFVSFVLSPGGDRMSSRVGAIKSISELALWVRDLDRSVAFYRVHLGFELTDLDPGHNAFLKSGDFLLVLFVRGSPGTPLGEEYLARTGGPRGEVYHVAFEVDPARLDGFSAGLRDHGLELKGPVEFASGRRSYFLEDLDEHYIELTDR
jgi:catechol 2,3-dioxygenase-like lactoylglutathione lyase family enzyme